MTYTSVHFGGKSLGLSLFLWLFVSFFNQAWAKTLVSEVDNYQIEMGDIITLRVTGDFQNYTDTPDFDSLKDQFDVLGTQRSSNVAIINGKYTSTTEWLAQLTPKQTGELRIPSFVVDGVRSNPLPIQVTQAKDYGTQNQITFIEAELSKPQSYVQEEVIYTLRFFHLGRLIDGNIRPPQFPNSLVKQLKDQQTYEKQINGQRYEVFEWRYAFYPQQSGTLTIAPQDFTGRLQIGGQLRAIHDNSKPISLTVLPKPGNYPNQKAWLPARSVTLKDQWQTANQNQAEIHVGDSLTRTLTLNVEGQLASQLPDINFENQSGLQIYPDQSLTDEKVALQGYRSEKLFKMAIIPTQAGKLTLPAIELPWWNTQTQTLEKVTIPAKTLEVLPALHNTPALPTPLAQNNPVPSVQAPAPAPDAKPSSVNWVYITAAVVVLWALTTLFLLRQIQRLKQIVPLPTPTADKTETTLVNPNNWQTLCQQNLTPLAFYRALQPLLQKSPAIAQQSDVANQLRQLKAHCFNAQPLDAQFLVNFCTTLQQAESTLNAQQKSADTSQLQSLYPTNPR